jgi:hypothetical protein
MLIFSCTNFELQRVENMVTMTWNLDDKDTPMVKHVFDLMMAATLVTH